MRQMEVCINIARRARPAWARLWWVIAKCSMVELLAGSVFSTKLFTSLNVSYEFQNISPASRVRPTEQVLIASPRHAFEIVVFHAP